MLSNSFVSALHRYHRVRKERDGCFCFLLFSYVCTTCQSLFTFPLGVIGKICSEIMSLLDMTVLPF